MSNDTPIQFPERQDVQEDLRALFRGAIRFTLEAFLEEELVEMIGAGRYQRVTHRRDTRNGSYLRRLLTGLGHVEVSVPRSRESGSPGGESLGRYKRRTEEVDAAICEAYVGGVSTRLRRLGQGLRTAPRRSPRALRRGPRSLLPRLRLMSPSGGHH